MKYNNTYLEGGHYGKDSLHEVWPLFLRLPGLLLVPAEG